MHSMVRMPNRWQSAITSADRALLPKQQTISGLRERQKRGKKNRRQGKVGGDQRNLPEQIQVVPIQIELGTSAACATSGKTLRPARRYAG